MSVSPAAPTTPSLSSAEKNTVGIEPSTNFLFEVFCFPKSAWEKFTIQQGAFYSLKQSVCARKPVDFYGGCYIPQSFLQQWQKDVDTRKWQISLMCPSDKVVSALHATAKLQSMHLVF